MADPLDRLRALFPSAPAAPDDERASNEARARAVAALVAVAVAFVLWFTFSMRETYTVSVEVPLQVRGLPDGRALRVAPPPMAHLQLQGEGWALLALSRTPPPLEIAADEATVNLRRAVAVSNRIPSGVTVQGVSPATITLALDERVTRTLPIRLAGRVAARAPYDLLTPPVLRPDSVRVTGARSVVAGLASWPTERVAFGDLRRTESAVVALHDTLAGLVERSVGQTEVTIPVEEFTEGERWLDVRIANRPAGVLDVRTTPARVRATYLVPTSGDHFDLAAESPDFYAVVDYADIARDTTEGAVAVTARVPDGLLVRKVGLEPQRLEYFMVRE